MFQSHLHKKIKWHLSINLQPATVPCFRGSGRGKGGKKGKGKKSAAASSSDHHVETSTPDDPPTMVHSAPDSKYRFKILTLEPLIVKSILCLH